MTITSRDDFGDDISGRLMEGGSQSMSKIYYEIAVIFRKITLEMKEDFCFQQKTGLVTGSRTTSNLSVSTATTFFSNRLYTTATFSGRWQVTWPCVSTYVLRRLDRIRPYLPGRFSGSDGYRTGGNPLFVHAIPWMQKTACTRIRPNRPPLHPGRSHATICEIPRAFPGRWANGIEPKPFP